MTDERDNERLVRQVERAVNDRDDRLLSEIFADDFVAHYHGGREEVRGLDEYRAYLKGRYEAFPDLSIDFAQVLVEGDMVAVRYTGTATHEGAFGDVDPTGESVDLSGMRVVRVEDGQIVEAWGQRDDLGILVQLGVVDSSPV
jgi:steroid delta-isomerase-like uncharacterized protein